jgi:hydrogenase-4 component E
MVIKFNLLAWISLAIVLCNLYILATARLPGMIRGVALQGVLLSVLPLLLPSPEQTIHMIFLVLLSLVIKGIVIPKYLFKAIRDVRVVHELNPVISNSVSVTYGILTSAFAFFILRKEPFASVAVSPFHTATAIATASIGLFLIITRRNVVGQIIGYLVFENAGFILAISIAAFQPLFVEMGVLLDMLVGIFIMVMVVNHIYTEHDTISIRSLEKLTR